MRLVDDVELRLQLRRRVFDALPKIANIVDATVAGGVDLDHVGVRAVVDGHARCAGVAGAIGRIRIEAIDRLGENACCGRLARAARTAEQVRMGDAVERDRILQRIDDVVLPE